MANIPLAEFPNAPAYPVDSALIQAPAPNFSFADLTAEVDSLMQTQISNDALRTYGRGLNQLAQGISTLGDLPDRIAGRFQEEKNKGDAAEVGNKIAKADAALRASLASTPLAEAAPAFEKQSSALREDLDAMQLAAPVRARANELYSRYYSAGLSRLNTAGHRAQIEKNKDNFLVEVDRFFDQGNYDLAHNQLQDMVRGGYLTAEAAETRYQKSISERHRRIEQAEIAEDPFSVAEDMRAASKTGHSTLFARSMSKDEISRTLGTATTAVRSLQYGAAKEILLGQRDGSMASEEDVRKRASAARLPDEVVTGLVHGLNHVEPDENPEIIAYFRENQMSARANVAAYNPANDPTQKKLFALIGEINERVPTSARPGLLDELFARREAGSITPGDSVRAGLLGSIRALHERGVWNRSTSKARESASTAASVAMDAAEKFLKANPDATSADAQKWMFAQFHPRIVNSRAAILSSN